MMESYEMYTHVNVDGERVGRVLFWSKLVLVQDLNRFGLDVDSA
jgi:ribonuclease D